MDAFLFLGTIGPVQEFISRSRRLQDLYVSSRMLSTLARTGIKTVTGQFGPQCQWLFPVSDTSGALPASVPHRFAFVAPGDQVAAPGIAKTIEAAIRDTWRHQFAAPVHAWLSTIPGLDEGWKTIFERQQDRWIEFYWVAVPYREDKHGDCYTAASVALAQRKLARQYWEVNEPGVKCTLTGTQQALFSTPRDWNPVRERLHDTGDMRIIRQNENLGTLATIKRLIQIALKKQRDTLPPEQARFWQSLESFPSARNVARGQPTARDTKDDERDPDEAPWYLAILHMDGDQMGTTLGTLATLPAHQAMSRALASFAAQASTIVEKTYHGRLIYAGGDDVLALLPPWEALPCAAELRTSFTNHLTGGGAAAPTISAGISIAPFDYPLDLALQAARDAEHQAKEDLQRDAVVLRENRGQVRPAGAKWGGTADHADHPVQIAPLMTILTELFSPDKHAQDHLCEAIPKLVLTNWPDRAALLSPSIGYDVQQIGRVLINHAEHALPSEARAAELGRLLARRLHESLPNPARTELQSWLQTHLAELGEAIGWDMLAYWIIIARFLSQQGAHR